MKFLFSLLMCLGSLAWAEEATVADFNAEAPNMRIGEQTGANGQLIAPGYKCDTCPESATNNQLNVVDLNYGVGTANGAAGSPQDGDSSSSKTLGQ